GSTGYGGSAYASNPECLTKLSAAECKSPLLVRKTGVVNSYFSVASVKNLGGTYESGKDDNQWSTFQVGSTKWMVLTLELWPRSGVVDWAKSVVANHPDYNVIIQTHHYLDGGGTISTSNGGYGATSPKYLYDQVVSKYSNVKMVFSGHVGSFTSRTDTNNGNTVVSYLGNEISGAGTLRVLTINPSTGVVKSTVYNGSLAVAGTTSNTIKVIG
ncbi:MAG: hypothetical protein KDB60_17815, partial [Propionibacteriaceae bacterium]|nr:hypothetical protein [Propionibacteriaceae bacterium]